MYGKIFDSMYDGTLASRGPWQALVTFQQFIVLANPDGVVDMTAHAISRRTSIPLEIIETGIAALTQPDPESRTPDEDGRRLVLLDDHRNWGWQIVNHAKYQAMRSAAERREYLRQAQQKQREKRKAEKVNSASTGVNKRLSKINTSTPTPTDASTSATTDEVSGSAPRAAPPTPPPDFDGKNANALNGKAVVALSPDFELPEEWGFDAEALGFKPAHVMREGEKFKQYWTRGKGSGTRRSVKGWRQTWSNWLEKAARDAR